MSLISLDQLSFIISDLNKEIYYKITENYEGMEEDFLCLMSIGDQHSIIFLGITIWSSEVEKQLEPDILPEVELTLNEREHFEKHIRFLIMDKINILKNLEV